MSGSLAIILLADIEKTLDMQQNQQNTGIKLPQNNYPDVLCGKRVLENYVKFKRNAVEMRKTFTIVALLRNPKSFQNSCVSLGESTKCCIWVLLESKNLKKFKIKMKKSEATLCRI